MKYVILVVVMWIVVFTIIISTGIAEIKNKNQDVDEFIVGILLLVALSIFTIAGVAVVAT